MSVSLVERTARAIYLAAFDGPKLTPFDALSKRDRDQYERMAKAALTEAYREPVTVPA